MAIGDCYADPARQKLPQLRSYADGVEDGFPTGRWLPQLPALGPRLQTGWVYDPRETFWLGGG